MTFFINDSTGWAVSSDGEIYKTENAGKNWVLKLGESTYFRSVEFLTKTLVLQAVYSANYTKPLMVAILGRI